MERKNRILINHVAHVLKLVEDYRRIRIIYDLKAFIAYVYHIPDYVTLGNGTQRYYSSYFINKLNEIAVKKSIKYKIGQDENIELHIQIYV